MTESRLDQVRRLVDQLTPLEQAQLLEYLAPCIARAVESSPPGISARITSEAWQEFLRIGGGIAASDKPEEETLTTAVLTMRR